jgi:hypothetical protein
VALTQRERYIAIGMGAVLGLLALDYFALTPYLEERKHLQESIDQETTKLSDNIKLRGKYDASKKTWEQMVADGLKSDPSEASYQLVQSIRQWAAEAGLTPVSIKPDQQPVPDNKNYFRVSVRFTATGSQAAVARLLYRIKEAKVPLRVNDVQVTSRREGTDDLQFLMTVSTLTPVPEAEKKDEKPRTVTVASAPGDRL